MFFQLGNWNSISWSWLLADIATQKTNVCSLDNVQNCLNDNSLLEWIIAVLAAVAAVAALLGNLDKIIAFSQKYIFWKKPEITEEQRKKVREDLIEIVLGQVVKRLEDSLHHKIRIDLKREEQRQRVGQQNLPLPTEDEAPDDLIQRSFNPFNEHKVDNTDGADQSTFDFFEREDIEGRLLILGEPGAGKTNELLLLAKELLQKAKDSPEAPIPVISELSEWNAEQELDVWLSQKLLEQYNVSLVISRHWIRNRQLIPLLDGLDELRRVDDSAEDSAEELGKRRQAKQIQCVRAINTFIDKFSLPLVACCRRKEYEAIIAKGEILKRLNGAIWAYATGRGGISQ